MLRNIGNSTPVLSSLEITENSKKTLIPLHYKIQQTPTPLAGNLLLINSLTLANLPGFKKKQARMEYFALDNPQYCANLFDNGETNCPSS